METIKIQKQTPRNHYVLAATLRRTRMKPKMERRKNRRSWRKEIES